jgi:iron(III) transport system permease protein
MNVPQAKREHRFSLSGIQINHFILTVVFLFLLGLPIIRMFFNLNRTSVLSVFQNPSFARTLSNSLQIATISTLITLCISYLLAYCIERTKIKHKGTFSILLVLPMLIPSISHGMGLILLLGNNGILTRLFHLNTTIYGKWGIVVGSVFYAFPVAFLMFVNVLKYEDSTPYEAAQVLGIPKWRQLTALTFPYLRRPLISIVFAIFTMIITDYGVPIIVGGKYSTLPVVLYQEVIGQLNFAKGSVYGVLLLIPASIAFLFDVLNADKGNASYVTHPFELQKNTLREVLAYGICILACLIVFLPIASFAILAFTTRYPSDLSATFKNVINTLNLNGGTYLFNSIIIAIAVALLGTFIAFSTAYLTARVRTTYSKYLHLITITSTAVPGIVLGLSYVLVFKTSFIYGTLAILIMVNLIHFISAPYLMMYDSLGKINENLEAVGQTLGIRRLRMIKDVFIPQSKATILEMASYFFVNCMMTISAVSFLATTSNKPISLMINQFEAQMQLENVAVVSLAILIINLVMKTLVKIITSQSSKHHS